MLDRPKTLIEDFFYKILIQYYLNCVFVSGLYDMCTFEWIVFTVFMGKEKKL